MLLYQIDRGGEHLPEGEDFASIAAYIFAVVVCLPAGRQVIYQHRITSYAIRQWS